MCCLPYAFVLGRKYVTPSPLEHGVVPLYNCSFLPFFFLSPFSFPCGVMQQINYSRDGGGVFFC